MKLRFITNACCIYEAVGFRLLADPWLVPGAFGTWVHDPPITTKPEDVLDVDALYISHIHPDHCDAETLKHFRRDIPIITLKDNLSLCAKHLAKLGFTNVVALADREQRGIGPFRVTMFGPFTKHPFHADDCEIGNVVDSALRVEHDGYSVLNCNDNAMSLEAAFEFRREYGSPTVAQLNYNSAGPYPACFRNLSNDEKLAESNRLIERHLDHMMQVADALRADYVMPFAGAYKLGFGYEHLNPYLGTVSAEYAAQRLRLKGFDVVELKENEVADLGKL